MEACTWTCGGVVGESNAFPQAIMPKLHRPHAYVHAQRLLVAIPVEPGTSVVAGRTRHASPGAACPGKTPLMMPQLQAGWTCHPCCRAGDLALGGPQCLVQSPHSSSSSPLAQLVGQVGRWQCGARLCCAGPMAAILLGAIRHRSRTYHAC